ncbi:AraC family transcriptional regulator [Streptomyces tendae]|uniref:AraC family transcriptional regulator n=1 Tax=Streptomyces tendae TaxID=1932 RepID=A0A6B3QVF6_STRTE|nr:AraC family transcriptional regulator [Streptomyces tendae]NEV90917.1 AraC family transcriptional regulator [Streptomyces tendae]
MRQPEPKRCPPKGMTRPGEPDGERGPTAHVSALRLLAAGLEGAGGDGVALVRRAGFAGQATTDDARVPTDRLSRLWRRGLGATDDPCLGVKAAGHWRFGRLRLMDYLVANAPTLADVFTVMEEYSALVNTAPNEIHLTGGTGSTGTVTYQIRSGDPDVDAMASQYALATVLFRARYVAGREIRPLHVGLTSDAPAHHRELAVRFGAQRLDFGADATTMTLASADLSLPLPDADARLGEILRQHAADVIATQARPSLWTGRLRQVVTDQLAGGGLSLRTVARALALSPRSLQRRLAEEGTTWRDLVDTVRHDRATVLLARGMSRKEVAARLGFADTRALRAALRRWRTDPAATTSPDRSSR